ncbi:hypothetical protein ACLB2K_009365 [Fragaria x ananassa]
MEDLSFMWTTYEESIDDLKQKILSTNLELESVKSLAIESQQNADMIRNLLHVAYKERDEAKNELQKVLNKINPNPAASVEQFPKGVQPESPIFIPPEAKSNNLFEACINPHSNHSSLVDSLLDAVSSPDLLNINNSKHMSFLNPSLTKELTGATTSIPTGVGLDAKFDYDHYIAKDKSLPKKGKLLQAVMDVGPLLKTLLATTPPLPQWRNPPTTQPLNLSLSLQGCKEILGSVKEKPVAMTSSSNFLNSKSYHGFSQTCSDAILDFNNVPSMISCKSSRPLTSSSYHQQIPAAKRCRLQ